MKIAKPVNCLLLIINVMVCACSINKPGLYHRKNGYYSFSVKKGSNASVSIIEGAVYDADDKKPLPSIGAVKTNSDNKVICRIDSKGHYQARVNVRSYRFTGVAVGYYSVTTKHIRIKAGDTLVVNFYLKPQMFFE